MGDSLVYDTLAECSYDSPLKVEGIGSMLDPSVLSVST